MSTFLGQKSQNQIFFIYRIKIIHGTFFLIFLQNNFLRKIGVQKNFGQFLKLLKQNIWDFLKHLKLEIHVGKKILFKIKQKWNFSSKLCMVQFFAFFTFFAKNWILFREKWKVQRNPKYNKDMTWQIRTNFHIFSQNVPLLYKSWHYFTS